MVQTACRAEWRSASMRLGAQSVMIFGTAMKLLSFAGNWGSQDSVSHSVTIFLTSMH